MSRSNRELWECARAYEVWSTLGWADIRLRYRRTMIGPLWVTFSIGSMVLSVGILYAGLFGSDPSSYIPYLASGVVIWMLISSTINEGCNVFVTWGGLIKGTSLPISNYVYRLVWKNVIIFGHNFLILIFLWIFFAPAAWLNVPWFLLGLVINLLGLVGVVLALSVLCTRFRDVPQIVAAAMQFVFFVTPVIWMPKGLRVTQQVVELNPVFHLIEIVRQPLLGNLPAAYHWNIAAAVAAVSLTVGIVTFTRFRQQITYWL